MAGSPSLSWSRERRQERTLSFVKSTQVWMDLCDADSCSTVPIFRVCVRW
jgi:hypothetical protein